jgi:hypothetical protein
VTMLEQVADLEPQVRQVVTHNDVGNAHMIAVNDSLGHRVTDEFQNFELNLPAAARALIRS